MVEEKTNPEETIETPEVQLSLADLAAVVQIIDITTKRGAFEGPELETIGAVRNRFAAFVDAQQKVNESEKTNSASTTDEIGPDVQVEEVQA